MNIKDALQVVAEDNDITSMHELSDACAASPVFFSTVVEELKATLETEGECRGTQSITLALNTLIENNKG